MSERDGGSELGPRGPDPDASCEGEEGGPRRQDNETERLGPSGPRGTRGAQTARVRKRGGPSGVRRAETTMEGERRGGRSEAARPQGEGVLLGSDG